VIDLPADFLDLLLDLSDAGADFVVVVGHAVAFEILGRAIPVIGLAALLKNKRAAGRDQDLADVKALEQKLADADDGSVAATGRRGPTWPKA